MRYNNSGYDAYYENNRGFIKDSNRGFKKDFKSDGRRRSHCRLVNGKKRTGEIYISGWKVGKAGFRSFFVSPAKSPIVKTSKTGKVWHSCKVKVINKTAGSSGLFPAWWHEGSNRVFVRDLGLLINPQTGYISYLKKKK